MPWNDHEMEQRHAFSPFASNANNLDCSPLGFRSSCTAGMTKLDVKHFKEAYSPSHPQLRRQHDELFAAELRKLTASINVTTTCTCVTDRPALQPSSSSCGFCLQAVKLPAHRLRGTGASIAYAFRSCLRFLHGIIRETFTPTLQSVPSAL